MGWGVQACPQGSGPGPLRAIAPPWGKSYWHRMWGAPSEPWALPSTVPASPSQSGGVPETPALPAPSTVSAQSPNGPARGSLCPVTLSFGVTPHIAGGGWGRSLGSRVAPLPFPRAPQQRGRGLARSCGLGPTKLTFRLWFLSRPVHLPGLEDTRLCWTVHAPCAVGWDQFAMSWRRLLPVCEDRPL